MQIRHLALAFAALASLTIFGSTGAQAQGTPLFAALLGGHECNGAAPPLCRQGDLNAHGSVSIIFPTASSACAAVTVAGGTTVVGAHIHLGVAGVNGGILVDFTPPAGTSAVAGAWGRCVAVAAATVTAIKANPANYYFNVHTSGVAPNGFPAGAVRGQLF